MESSQSKKSRISSLINAVKKHFKNNYLLYLIIVSLALLSSFILYDKQGLDRFISIFFISALLIFVFCKDIMRYKPVYIKNPKMLLVLAIIFGGTLLLIKFSYLILDALNKGFNLGNQVSFIYGIPVPVGAMLITLIFDFHTAIMFSFIISILTGIWFYDPSYTVFAFLGCIIGAFSIIRCKKRSAILRAGMIVSLVNVVTAVIAMMARGDIFNDIVVLHTMIYALLSGFTVSSFLFVLLPFFEYVFSLTTDISLLELLDLEHPLMKSLMISAPGTYHHSIIVGNLAESAAEAIGVNPLLARVAAYYHDIGKMKMPEYFVENQTAGINKHDKLTPHMSSMILISHVKEGIELAKQHKIPAIVSDAIQQHHGTSLIAYFYQKAIEQNLGEAILQDDYRYPGPKPQTRIAALIMMADAVEAASRTLIDPTPARISALVERIINNIFLDGQIDECELTLKDLSVIKKKFTYILTSIFHKRIIYPELSRLKGLEKSQSNGRSKEQDKNGNTIAEQATKGKDKSEQP
ncbi:MAG: HDIG domain-containing protein [Thermodesulfovibrionales bacterium]|nr:HDIG domain-containing protein [Thermodesulfovibrionales bacterium]